MGREKWGLMEVPVARVGGGPADATGRDSGCGLRDSAVRVASALEPSTSGSATRAFGLKSTRLVSTAK